MGASKEIMDAYYLNQRDRDASLHAVIKSSNELRHHAGRLEGAIQRGDYEGLERLLQDILKSAATALPYTSDLRRDDDSREKGND